MTAVLAAATSTESASPEHRLPHRVWNYPATPRSVRAARQDVAAQLRRWRLAELTDPAVVVVSELASNALAASQRARHQGGDDDAVSRIAVRLTYSHHDVVVEVWDGAAGRPTRRAAGPDAEDGRGLHLVTALTRATGYYEVRLRNADDGDRNHGKVVWAVLPHGAPPVRLVADAPPDDLPRRDPSPSRGDSAPDPEAVDLALLRRVVDGLRALDEWTRLPLPTRSDRHAPPT